MEPEDNPNQKEKCTNEPANLYRKTKPNSTETRSLELDLFNIN